MNNEVLMRRIAAATEAQKQATASVAPSADARAQQDILRRQVATPVEPRQAVSSGGNGVAPPPISREQMPIDGGRRATDIVQQGAAVNPPAEARQPEPMITAQPVVAAPAHTPVQATRPTVAPQVAAPAPVQPVASPEMSMPTQELAEPQPVGILVSCDGVHAAVESRDVEHTTDVAVGRMVTIGVGTSQIVGLIYKLTEATSESEDSSLRLELELQGEVSLQPDGSQKFSKGISKYPTIGSVANVIRPNELATLYASTGRLSVTIGELAQESTIAANIDIEEMLSKHFAILGSTGCGKSSAVSLLLRRTWEAVPDLRTIVLDPHNEYACAFPEAVAIDSASLALPFWMFQMEEFAEVMFRGKEIDEEELAVLRELIPEARQRFRDGEERTSLRNDNSQMLTADTPVPYRMSDVLALIEEEIGLLEARFQRPVLKSLKARIVAHSSDPRYRFMFRDKSITDRAEEVVDMLFNLHGNRSNMTILMMAGLPTEVINVLASVICRLSFELCIAGEGSMKSLVVCEEAHRYIPDGKHGFEPSRRAIARIAKEGRKYGSFISIVSQRPAELDPTILSQCSTIFSLRLSNEEDQLLMRKAISNASRSTIAFLSSLANREAIAFGEGLLTPMRLRFQELPRHHLPGKDRDVFAEEVSADGNIGHVFHQWRGDKRSAKAARQVA